MPPYLVFCALPDGWERFDLWEPGAEAPVAARLDERLAQQGVDAAERQALTRAATAALSQARRAGLVVWAVQVAAPDPARPLTLTVGVHAIPAGGPAPESPAAGIEGGPSRSLSLPTRPRPLDLLFDDAIGLTREWALRIDPAESSPTTMFCAQAVVVSRSSPVAATVTVSAFEPADEAEVRKLAASVARSVRLATASDGLPPAPHPERG